MATEGGDEAVDLTAIRLREDEREEAGAEDATDLPALFDQLEQSLSACAASPQSSPSRARGREPHDSDDDMQQEEARLLDSTEKLRRVMEEARFHDAEQGPEASPAELIIPQELLFVSPAPSPSPAPAPRTPAQQPVSLSLHEALDQELSQQAVLEQQQYWECPGDNNANDPEGGEEDGFETPLGTAGTSRPATATPGTADNDAAGWAMCRSASAYSLGVGSPTVSPIRRTAEEEEEDGTDGSGSGREEDDDEEDKQEEEEDEAALPVSTPLMRALQAAEDKEQAQHQQQRQKRRAIAQDREEDDRDMHEVVCASERLSEAAILQRFSGLRGIGQEGPEDRDKNTATADDDSLGELSSTGSLCRHLALINLRPDAVCGAITAALASVAQAQGLVVTKRQGPHVVADTPSSSRGKHQWEWRSVDMQLAVDRRSRDRVLLVRFLMAGSPPSTPRGGGGSSSGSGHDAQQAAEAAEARRKRPATKRFLQALKEKLVAEGFNRQALSRLRGCRGIQLDSQFLCQLEDLAREGMNRSLEAQARVLEDYARAAEWKCSQLKELLQPMFDLYKVEQPLLGKPLPLSYYPLDLLSAYEGGGPQAIGDEEDEAGEGGDEQQQHQGAGTHPSCGDCLACVEALKARAWSSYLRQCDAEMTARLQRKNMQVVDRLGRVSDYQRCLLRTLRDNRHRMSIPLFRTFQAQTTENGGSGSGSGEDVETPLYYCRCIVAARPATLYVTYGHLFFISRVPGFSINRRVAFRDVRSASLSSLRLGIRLAKAIEVEVPASKPGSSSNEVIAFSSTTEPERLIELIKLLMSIHAEAEGDSADDEVSEAGSFSSTGRAARLRQAL